MSARRILLVHSSSGRYGADRQLHLIAAGLDRARYEPTVVLPSPGPLASDLQAAGVEVLIRELSVIRRAGMNPRGLGELMASAAQDARELGRLIGEKRFSLVHSNTSVILGGAAAAAVARVPHLWHVREIYAGFGRLWPPYRRLLATAGALPCVSEATAAQFALQPRARVRVVLDGLAIDPQLAARDQARVALGIDAQAPVLAVLGRISDWKGQDVLINAMAEPPLRERGAIALIAGDAWSGAEERIQRVLALAESLGVHDRVALVGFRDDVENVYGAADVVVVPSTEPDPLPGAAIEAAAAGCAVIASAHGGLPEIIRDRRTGRLVPPRDAKALARVAAELLDDPAERTRLGEAAALDVRDRFQPSRLIDSVQALYDEVLNR